MTIGISNNVGLFVTFEGGDGVGKSTQLKELAKRLRADGQTVTETREPGGVPGAEAIRELLVTGQADRWTPLAEALMMNAARAEHLDKKIVPALQRGEIVLCDRFADSTMAYQGYAGAVGQQTIEQLYQIVVGPYSPDVTFILHTKPGQGLDRAKARGSDEQRFESKGSEYQNDVAKAFVSIAHADPDRCLLVDAQQSIDTAADTIFQHIKDQYQDKLASLRNSDRS